METLKTIDLEWKLPIIISITLSADDEYHVY